MKIIIPTLLGGLAALVLTLSPAVRAQTLVVSGVAPNSGYSIELADVVQVEDTIWFRGAIRYVTPPGYFDLQAITYPWITVPVAFPSLIATRKTQVGGPAWIPQSAWPEDPDVTLYSDGAWVGTYDPELGDGWVDTDAAGWLYVRAYPQVFHPVLGWMQVAAVWLEYGSLFAYTQSVITPGVTGRGYPYMTYVFHHPTLGWLWKSPYARHYRRLADYRDATPEELLDELAQPQ